MFVFQEEIYSPVMGEYIIRLLNLKVHSIL
nr:MAG TPA: hypothetical protein [Caudoviricetes sp.]